jgi:2-amino-4-hydroxy-6-hydroxymethyldihydropteridine diphosphokinase
VGREEINIAYIALGSNLGDKKSHLDNAIQILNSTIGNVIKQADYIETEPIDMLSKDLFLNTCIELKTPLSAIKLLVELKKIEENFGRNPSSKGKNESRTLDLDIIFFNQLIYSSIDLTIPHPRYHVRDFVLYPLKQINEHFVDPCLKLTIKQLIN